MTDRLCSRPNSPARRLPGRRRLLPVAPLALLTLTLPAAAAPEVFVIDPTHTFPTFEVSHLGYSFHRGRFNTTAGTITLDREAQRGRIEVSIDTTSLDTGHDKMEQELKGKDFFDVARYPTLRFQSDRLVFNEQRVVAAHGTLTLLGVSQPVTLKLNHFRCATNPLTKKYSCGANAVATINRSEFGMTKYVPYVGDEVTITIQVEAARD